MCQKILGGCLGACENVSVPLGVSKNFGGLPRCMRKCFCASIFMGGGSQFSPSPQVKATMAFMPPHEVLERMAAVGDPTKLQENGGLDRTSSEHLKKAESATGWSFVPSPFGVTGCPTIGIGPAALNAGSGALQVGRISGSHSLLFLQSSWAPPHKMRS